MLNNEQTAKDAHPRWHHCPYLYPLEFFQDYRFLRRWLETRGQPFIHSCYWRLSSWFGDDCDHKFYFLNIEKKEAELTKLS